MSFMEKQSIHHFNAGDIIFKEKDPGASMFIIQSGEVVVSKIINKQKVELALLKKGAIFGEMSLVDDMPRSATITARRDTICLEISRMLFNKRLKEIPAWMQAFYEILVGRLREANSKQNTLDSGDVSKQIVFLLSTLLSKEKPDSLDRVALPWNETAENLAFLLNIPIDQVMKAMNKISLTPLAKGELNYERGRMFLTDDIEEFKHFAEFCKERYFAKLGKDMAPEFEGKSVEEIQLLKFINKLMTEQATASDLHHSYFDERCQKDLGKPLEDFTFEIHSLMKKGVLASRIDESGDKYYEVSRESLNIRLNTGETLEMFEKIEEKLN